MSEQIITILLALGPVFIVTVGSIIVAIVSGKRTEEKHQKELQSAKEAAEVQATERADALRLQREERLQQWLENRNAEQEKRMQEQDALIRESQQEAIELRDEVFALRVVALQVALALKNCLGEAGIPQELKDALDAAGIKNY